MGFLSSVAGSVGKLFNNVMGVTDSSENAFAQNMSMMQYQNEYNKPINQMKRLQEAGLNPNLVYGSGGTTVLSASPSGGSVGTGSGGSAVAGLMNSLFQYLGTKREKETAEIKVADATAKQIEASTRGIELKNIGQEIANRVAGEDYATLQKTGLKRGSIVGDTVSVLKKAGDKVLTPIANWLGDTAWSISQYPTNLKKFVRSLKK